MSKTIWVLVELENDRPARSSLEVLGKAASLGRAEAIVLGSQAAAAAPPLGEYGAEKVYVHADAAYDTYLTLPAADTLGELIKQHQPDLLMLATTYDLRDIAARLNARHNMGLITDATELQFEGDTLKVTVPWGGENVVTATLPQGTGIVLTLIGALVGFVAEVASAITLYRATLRRSLLEWRDQPKRRGPLTSSQSGWQSATPASPSRQGTNEAGVRTGTARARRAPWS